MDCPFFCDPFRVEPVLGRSPGVFDPGLASLTPAGSGRRESRAWGSFERDVDYPGLGAAVCGGFARAGADLVRAVKARI